jgi:hypothetical protein
VTDVETRLRGVFADDAGAAPDADLLALAGAVRGTVRRERRRRASVAGALAVLGVAAGLLVVPRVLPATVTTPASQAGPASPFPSASPGPVPPTAEEPALRWRGVVVPVPASYLGPGALRCGTAIANAAYVDRPGAVRELCLATPEHPERLTTVVLSPWDPTSVSRPPRPEQVLKDGRVRLATRVPGAPVVLTVTSPDPALARRLLDGARLEATPPDCPLEATDPPDRVRDAAPELGGDPVEAWVCSYTGGWLDSWSRVVGADAGYLMLLLRAPVPPGPRPQSICDARLPGVEDHWLVTLRGSGPAFADDGTLPLWVAAGPCREAGVHTPDGALVPLTQPLVGWLMARVPGIGAAYNVVGGPKS